MLEITHRCVLMDVQYAISSDIIDFISHVDEQGTINVSNVLVLRALNIILPRLSIYQYNGLSFQKSLALARKLMNITTDICVTDTECRCASMLL